MTMFPLRPRHLALAFAAALVATLAAGCGDNKDCQGDQCVEGGTEICVGGADEDGDATIDCLDSDCTADPACGPQCGNGIQNVGEGCDDGNRIDTDECTNTCNRARCGDGIPGPGEQCDDGNSVNTDACTSACTTARCGDGFAGPGEQCDDGNNVNTDGCTSTCRNAACGDGFVQMGEQCDDGNMVDTDACTNACTTARCGDGITGPGEQCDDANLVNTDACTNVCQSARCGDGFAGPGEACDDGNLINTDGCTNMCRLPSCGDGFVQMGEQCDDGNMVNTDACLNTCVTATCGDGVTQTGVEQCDDMNQVNTDACLNTCRTATCGDTVVQTGVEQCDDGNMVNTDACTNVCQSARCGDGFQQMGEACDDGNMVNNDGCTNMCTVAGCGDGIVGPGEQCDDMNMVNGDGCDNNCTSTACGNGVRTGTEACDDGNVMANDGCSPTCTLECGNGMLNTGEQCDDGNTTPVDGCGPTCRIEPMEVEPNEDGTPASGGGTTTGNDFDAGGMLAINNATMNALVLASGGSTARISAINPVGDEDVYAIRNDTAAAIEVRLDVWLRAAGFGAGVSCGTGVDTVLNLRDATGTVLATSDDRSSSDWCSGLGFALPAMTTIYAQVIERGDNAVINTPGYGLQVQFIPIVCGDTRVVSGVEECDDGNTAANDGCSAACVVEGTTETEPNEDGVTAVGGTGIVGNDFDVGGMLAVNNATTQGVFNVASGRRNWLAALTPAGDEDVFALTNAGAQTFEVTVDTWDRQTGVGVPCLSALTDTGINVRDAAGVVLTSNDNRVTGDSCSRVTFIMGPGQNRYVHVTEVGDNAIVTRYVAAVSSRAIVCGDGTQTPSVEECDDGNTANGDGCSMTCTVEGVTETEPNEDGTPSVGGSTTVGNDFDVGGMLAVNNATTQGVLNIAASNRTWRGALSAAGDEDVYAITNGGASAITVQADTWDLTLGINRPCPTATTDTAINVRDAAGVVALTGDDRVSGTDACSRVSFGLLPGQTRYVHVVEYGDNAVVAKYALVVRGTPVICGDNAIGFGEECDGGNNVPGDGCSATCQLEAPVSEVEPNGTSAEADAAPAAVQIAGDKVIRGSIGPATDLDRFKVTVADQTVVRFETFAPLPGDCDGTTTTLRLFDSTGTSILTDSTSGIASCSAIVIPLAAGTYYIQVEESGTNALINKYFLEVDFQTDRGMEGEAAGMMGTNDTFMAAEMSLVGGSNVYVFGDHTLNADNDYYAITVPAGARIRAEVVEGNRGTVAPAETCESNGIDSVLELRDQAGTLIVSDDDDGRGFCSELDGTGTTALDSLARNSTATPQTYFLVVRQSGTGTTAAGQFVYRLAVTIR